MVRTPERLVLASPPSVLVRHLVLLICKSRARTDRVYGPHEKCARNASATDPVGERRAVDLDAIPGEDLALPVEWKVIAVFGDQDMSEQGRTGQPLADRPLRGDRKSV